MPDNQFNNGQNNGNRPSTNNANSSSWQNRPQGTSNVSQQNTTGQNTNPNRNPYGAGGNNPNRPNTQNPYTKNPYQANRPNPYQTSSNNQNINTNRPNPYQSGSNNSQNRYTNDRTLNTNQNGNNKNQTSYNNPNAYMTEEERRRLQRLNNQMIEDEEDDDRRRGAFWLWFRRALVILLILILLAGIGVAIYFFARGGSGRITSGSDIKLSFTGESYLSEGGTILQSTEIYPGDRYNLKCSVRNSDNIAGDKTTGTYINIFIRFTILIDLDGVEYYNVVNPEFSDLDKGGKWHIYNESRESKDWDGWYYYYGSLKKNEELTLFNEISFNLGDTLRDFAGKQAKIVVKAEALPADVSILGEEDGDAWSTAPLEWIENMESSVNQLGETIHF